jgi:glutamate racemase
MTGPVLVFDSGVGGLSVASAIRRRFPDMALAYACDNAMLPYGVREDAWLVERILVVCRAAVEASGCSALVVACNTASTLALEVLRRRLEIPVIGTVPAIKPAARLSRSRHFGLLATRATVSRPYTLALIREFADDCVVTRVAADALVGQAEGLLAGDTVNVEVIHASLAPLWEDPVLDTVVLGCTHFPLLSDALVEASPRPLTWIDSGDAIARRVAQVLPDPPFHQGASRSFVTLSDPRITSGLASFGFARPSLLSFS